MNTSLIAADEIAQLAGEIKEITNFCHLFWFDYKEEYDPHVTNDVYQVNWNPAWDDVDLYIAAHAVVWGIYL